MQCVSQHAVRAGRRTDASATRAAVGSEHFSRPGAPTPRARHAVGARRERTRADARAARRRRGTRAHTGVVSPDAAPPPDHALAMRVLGLLASVRALQFTPSALPVTRRRNRLSIDPIAVTTESEYAAARWLRMLLSKRPNFQAINAKDMDKL